MSETGTTDLPRAAGAGARFRPPVSAVPGPSGRLAHPAGSGRMGREDEPPGQLSFVALRAIAAGMARAQEPVPANGDPGARSVRLLATTFYDVWLITWPDGSGLPAHDHGGARSVMQVLAGELEEVVADGLDRRPPRARVLRQGDSTCAPPSFIHQLANRSGSDATTIHAYSPPLADLAYFGLQPDGAHAPLGARPVAERIPHASSRDLRPVTVPSARHSTGRASRYGPFG